MLCYICLLLAVLHTSASLDLTTFLLLEEHEVVQRSTLLFSSHFSPSEKGSQVLISVSYYIV